jgi:hypothetical protein
MNSITTIKSSNMSNAMETPTNIELSGVEVGYEPSIEYPLDYPFNNWDSFYKALTTSMNSTDLGDYPVFTEKYIDDCEDITLIVTTLIKEGSNIQEGFDKLITAILLGSRYGGEWRDEIDSLFSCFIPFIEDRTIQFTMDILFNTYTKQTDLINISPSKYYDLYEDEINDYEMRGIVIDILSKSFQNYNYNKWIDWTSLNIHDSSDSRSDTILEFALEADPIQNGELYDFKIEHFNKEVFTYLKKKSAFLMK